MSNQHPEMRDIIVRAIAAVANRSPDELHDDVDLLDLGLDSLDFARILIEIEDAMGSEMPPYVLDRIMDETPDVITMGSVLHLLSSWDTSDGDFDFRPQDEVVVISAEDLATS